MARPANVERKGLSGSHVEQPDSGMYAVVNGEDTVSALAPHDAKKLLGVLAGNVERLREGVRSGTERKDLIEALDDLESCARRLTEIVERAVEPQKTAAAIKPCRAPVNVSTVLQAVYQQVRRQAAASDVSVVVRILADAVARIDRSLIERVLVNLVDNALRFAPRGSSVRIGCNVVDDRVELMVSDEGPGVEQGQSERIFEPYFTTSGGAFPGEPVHAGLGLAFCRAVARAHGGDVRAEAVPPSEGKGGRFVVDLPLTA